jgi:hypothetical protein
VSDKAICRRLIPFNVTIPESERDPGLFDKLMAERGGIRPQLTRLVDAAPEGEQWLHEIKIDGYRMHARLDRGAVQLLTRTGLDWTQKYPAIAAAVATPDARQAYLDGPTASPPSA